MAPKDNKKPEDLEAPSPLECIVGFPRDGTSRGTSHCPCVPGQKHFLVPVSLCPGTRAGANVLGQNPLSRDIPGQNELKTFK